MYKKMAFRPKRGSGRSGNRGGNRGRGIEKREIGNRGGFAIYTLFLYFLKFLFPGLVPNYLLHLYWKLGLYISYGDTR